MSLQLDDGSRIGVVGGGPAGSLAAYFLLSFAGLMEMDIRVDVYEPRDFGAPGPAGCNMCGGIVSESLVQALAIEGIDLPETVVQRGIDSYVLHTDATDTRIDTPLREKRIAAIHRGGGPRDLTEVRWGGLDGHLLSLAEQLGASVLRARVTDADWNERRPRVKTKQDGAQTYDLLIGATGINSSAWDLYEKLGIDCKRPTAMKCYVTEVSLGYDAISRHFGSSMHIFLLDLPRLDCAAIIPKGDFVTVCLLGQDIDRELVDSFFSAPAVRRCFPDDWTAGQGACHCQPRMNVKEAKKPYLDRLVLVGDAGATRLNKDGIGGAYRTARAAARTAVFSGVSAPDFEKSYLPTYRSIARDNRYGELMFHVIDLIKRFPPAMRGCVRMTAQEQRSEDSALRMSMTLWDMFTGSQDYRTIFYRTLDPRFIGRFALDSALSVSGSRSGDERTG
ncbi:MAG TPA: hypothetical protein VJ787_09755 [Thermoleophilia bacterium]|nr:hypothetical protein [Thermoleophilia bacterium]